MVSAIMSRIPTGPAFRRFFAAAVAALILSVNGSWVAQADYVSGLNPRGDNFLSLRSGPGTGYEELLRMGPDTIVTVIESRGTWRRIELEDGTQGWAYGKYIKSGFPPGYEAPEQEPQLPVGELWETWRSASSDASVDYPADIFTPGETPPDGAGVTFSTDDLDASMEVRTLANSDGLAASGLRRILHKSGERAIDRQSVADGMVISGSKAGELFYRKALLSPDRTTITILDIRYSAELQDILDPLVAQIGDSLSAAGNTPGTTVAEGAQGGEDSAATAAGGTTPADLERLRLQAEIERLRLETLRLEQQAGGSKVEPTTLGKPGGTATLPQGRRVALVIGNGAYQSVTALTTPANDARVLAERLTQLGYEVSLGVDRNRGEMAELLADFYGKAGGAAIALFYFSGHGMQIEGRNYLLPVDAVFSGQASFLDVDAQAFDLQKFIAVSSTAQISVVFVDACRDNPIVEKSLASSLLKGTSVSKGLAVIQRESLNSGQFVGFAAEPGKTAETGTGDVSVYTQALLKGLEEPGLDISIMHRRIRGEVEAATDGRQSPRYVDDLADAFTLNPGQ
ncbi:caspase family protein [Devosia sp.]|jgi:hypothetical protein|uniref:caspase family protein n=1 Tax=Devosia sp. TaxID=1871048 RepID=UPI0037BF4D85